MSSFSPVNRETVAHDAVNISHTTYVPPRLLAQDKDRWYQLLSDKDRPSKETKTTAAFFIERSKETLELGRMAMYAVAANMPEKELRPALIRVSAQYALSRLVNLMIPEDEDYVDEDDDYEGTSESKFLIDYAPNFLDERGAYSIILSKDRLTETPFEDEPTDLEQSGQWYRNEQNGLYVVAQSPAIATPVLMENLALATKGMSNAQSVIDSYNSVNLYPYLSYGFLNNAARQH